MEHCLADENCCPGEGLKCVKLCVLARLHHARLQLMHARARPRLLRRHYGFYTSKGVCLKEECTGPHISGSMYDELSLLNWLQCGVNWGECSWDWSAGFGPKGHAAAAANSCVAPTGISAGAALPAACFGEGATAKVGVHGLTPPGAAALVATSDDRAAFAPTAAGDTGLRLDFAVPAGAFGAWFSLAPPGGAPATGRAAGRSTLEAAARGAPAAPAAARGSASARSVGGATAKAAAGTGAGITVSGLNAAGAVIFTTTSACAIGQTECFIGWAAPDAAASKLVAVTIAAPVGSAVVPALRAMSFFPAAKPAASSNDLCGVDLAGGSSWTSS